MNVFQFSRCLLFSFILSLGTASFRVRAQPQIIDAKPSAGEIIVRFTSPASNNSRLEVSADLVNWAPLYTFPRTAATQQHTDTSAPSLPFRFYRVAQLDTTNALTGDHLLTDDGDVVIHPLFHAAVVLGWKDKTIYVDPETESQYASRYQNLPKADLVLITHSHGDHFNASQINAVRNTNGIVITPRDGVYTGLSTAVRAFSIIQTNGASTNVLGISIDSIPAYNSNHPLGSGNGYVLTIGGKRFYFSGDTGAIAEMRALQNIDVAFLCMNVPFTMTVNEAASNTRAFRPKAVYPYHYRNQDGTLSNLNSFKQMVGSDVGVEVRQRAWY